MQTPTDAEIEKNKHLVPKRENDSDCQGLKYGNPGVSVRGEIVYCRNYKVWGHKGK